MKVSTTLRREALQLAVSASVGNAATTVEAAEAFYRFLSKDEPVTGSEQPAGIQNRLTRYNPVQQA